MMYDESTVSYKFSDGEYYCEDWFQMYGLTNALIYIVPMLISMLNTISKYILRYLSTVEK